MTFAYTAFSKAIIFTQDSVACTQHTSRIFWLSEKTRSTVHSQITATVQLTDVPSFYRGTPTFWSTQQGFAYSYHLLTWLLIQTTRQRMAIVILWFFRQNLGTYLEIANSMSTRIKICDFTSPSARVSTMTNFTAYGFVQCNRILAYAQLFAMLPTTWQYHLTGTIHWQIRRQTRRRNACGFPTLPCPSSTFLAVSSCIGRSKAQRSRSPRLRPAHREPLRQLHLHLGKIGDGCISVIQ